MILTIYCKSWYFLPFPKNRVRLFWVWLGFTASQPGCPGCTGIRRPPALCPFPLMGARGLKVWCPALDSLHSPGDAEDKAPQLPSLRLSSIGFWTLYNQGPPSHSPTFPTGRTRKRRLVLGLWHNNWVGNLLTLLCTSKKKTDKKKERWKVPSAGENSRLISSLSHRCMK